MEFCDQLLLQFSVDVSQTCRHIVDILKMCMWVFDGARINFDRITAFQTYLILAVFFLHCKHGNYKVFLFL